jgi:TrfA protein
MDSIGTALQGMKERMEANKELSRKREEEYYESGFIQLPLWPEEKRGSPNSFLRSALFAAIQSKDRVMLKEITLGSQQGIKVKYTGEQLNQEDLTVWLGVVDLVKQHSLGTECSFSAYAMLKHMGMDTGGKSHQKLRESILRMAACVLTVTDGKMTFSDRIIDRFNIDEETKQYRVILGRHAIKLFGENEWTALEEKQRRLLVKKPLASFLHGYYSSHEKPLSVSLEFLSSVSGSRNSQQKDFKRKVRTALEELVKCAFLKSYDIEGDMVKVERMPKPYQHKTAYLR